MGFLPKLFSRSFKDVDIILQKVDERISKIEGVHGNYEPKQSISFDNISKISQLDAPISDRDAVRYSDSARYRSMTFTSASLTANTSYVFGGGQLAIYQFPCDVVVNKIWLFGLQSTIGGITRFQARKITGAATLASREIATCALTGLAGRNGYYMGTKAICNAASNYISKNDKFYCSLYAGANPIGSKYSAIVDFYVVDK